MARFRDLSIRAKLMRTAMLASAVALLSASTAFVVFDLLTYRSGMARRLSVAADIVGSNCIAPLLFEDRPAAGKTLAALRAETHVTAAALYDRKGMLFAAYLAGGNHGGAGVPAPLPPGTVFSDGRLTVVKRIAFQGAPVGTVVIESDLQELAERLRRYALIVVIVSLASLLMSVLISSRLQRAIAGPILSLAETARQVSVEENYSARASGGGRDETGLLIATFNEMLERIQAREAELVDARSDLERRVAERTAALRRELSERARTEQELRRARDLLSEAQAMARVGSWEWDLATDEVWWSEELYRLYGLDPGDFRPSFDAIAARLHPEDRERTTGAFRRAAAGGESLSDDHRVIRPDGGVRLFHTEAHAVRGEQGQIVQLRGLEQDVTDQRMAEEERARLVREQAAREEAESGRRRAAFLAQVASVLASSLDWERTVSAAARLAVPEMADWALVDAVEPSGILRRVAIAHRQRDDASLGPLRRVQLRLDSSCPSAEAIRRGRAVLAGPEDRCGDEDHETMLDALGRGHVGAFPFFVQGEARGVLLWCRASAPYDASEVLVAEDVARRTGTALEHATLYADAQEANRLKDEFLATLSHELRTPLHAIVGWAHMLRAGSLDAEKTRRALESIERNAQAQNQLISDVLDVSRIVAGKLRLNARALDLRDVVEGAVDTVRPAAEARRVALRASLPDAPAIVSGDADRLQQVVWNLLANAIKFVPEGGNVEVRLAPDGTGHVELTVEDDGPGIRPDFLPHVFERFRQADSSSTRPHGGLGLGLAIVRHLVELHGGTAHAANRTGGNGASFTISLPARAQGSGAAAGDSPPAEAPAARGRSAALRGVRVLVVDDEADAREMLATALEMEGGEVLLAGGAEEALAVLRRERPDVLLSDVEMPGVDGYELLRRIRSMGPAQGGSIPAAALTAYASPEHRARAMGAGFQMHVPKPVDPSRLAAVVASLAGRRAHGVAVAAPRSRILVVDDNPDVAESLQMLLEAPGREVRTALDGEAALALAGPFRPDLVLLDLGLPGMDGCEVATRLRALPGLGAVKLVALSGHGGPELRERTRGAGFERHLVKPVDPEALLALVETLSAAAAADGG